MRSRSGDKCLADKYPPWSIFGPNMFKHSLYGNVETDLIMKTWLKYNKVDHENEVKVRWHMPGWHAPLWSMCGQNMVSLVCTEWRNWSIHKNDIVNVVTAASGKAIPLVTGKTKPGERCIWYLNQSDDG